MSFLIRLVLCCAVFSPKYGRASDERNVESKTWALLVAGSNGWWNYRHQADICHAYQIVRAHGIPDENIVVMMYDDIANNSQNFRKGQIINHPNGSDVYKNVPKDYTGKDVTPENFLKILLGDEKSMKHIGSGKVIKSTKYDRVFVNFVDHGASGILCFPGDDPVAENTLTAGDLIEALKKMHTEKKFGEMVMYIEACESGSIFRNILPSDLNIFVTTAADYNESSYACYCQEDLDTCLGDLYSVSWMEDTDRRDITKESLYEQFSLVKKETNMSHVKEFGTLKMAKLPVGEFQGEDRVPPPVVYPIKTERVPISSSDVPLKLLEFKMKKNSNKSLKIQYKTIIKARDSVTQTINSILSSMSKSPSQAVRWMNEYPRSITDLDCHKQIVNKFSRECFNFGRFPYALKYVYTLTNMCNDGVLLDNLTAVFRKHCVKDSFPNIVV